MQLKDIAINGVSIIFLISLIVLAVRPQSNLVQIEKRTTPSEIDSETEKQDLPQEIDRETLAKD
ncbi:MAG: hypothetical protein ACFBSE_12890 [Prochloraceae cyanobacterium]